MKRIHLNMVLLKAIYLWSILLLGLINIHGQCEARAVNVSNTWTMPQEGLDVFYRFFRDRISWFEADAVCQFHHANLVTVDNSFQFDATRDLLGELDVNDIVWIGLIRPQSSERFMWSNSIPLLSDTGYWAESLPVMDAPLCAVIDPIRDYRWHALRCGGPETASFLCEMTVPTWADVCILKDIPDLTIQYMSDTASVELIRTCNEEGTLRQTCKGEQDRERIQRELLCPRERMETKIMNDITNPHFKSLEMIKNIHTDNKENNDIDLVPINVPNYDSSGELMEAQQTTEKNTVQRLIEQFNVDELMQADQPEAAAGHTEPQKHGQIPKPAKKKSKKYTPTIGIDKKKSSQSATNKDDEVRPKTFAFEDMMMGDQPQGEPELVEHVVEDGESNNILEHLPHQKKILPHDLKEIIEEPIDTTTIAHLKHKPFSIHPVDFDTSTMGENLYASEEITTIIPKNLENNYHDESSILTGIIGHPIHPQQTHRMNINLDAYPHIKETVVDNSHFIPPLLMVKSHYVPSSKHEHEHVKYSEQLEPVERPEHHVHLHALPTTTTSGILPILTTTTAGSIKEILSTSKPLHAITTVTDSMFTTKAHVNDLRTARSKISEYDGGSMAISSNMTYNIFVSSTKLPLNTSTATPATNIQVEGQYEEELPEKSELKTSLGRTTSLSTIETVETTTTKTSNPIDAIINQTLIEIIDTEDKINHNRRQIKAINPSLPATEIIPTIAASLIDKKFTESMISSASVSSSSSLLAAVVQLNFTTDIPDLRVSTAMKPTSSKRTLDSKIKIRTSVSTKSGYDDEGKNADGISVMGKNEGVDIYEAEDNLEEKKNEKTLLGRADKAQQLDAKVADDFSAASNVGQQGKQLLLDLKTSETLPTTTITTTPAAKLIFSSSELPNLLSAEEKPQKTLSLDPLTTTTPVVKIQSHFIHNIHQPTQAEPQIEKANSTNNNKKNNEFEIPSTFENKINISTKPPPQPSSKKSKTDKMPVQQKEEMLRTSTYRNFYVEDTTVQFRPNRKRMLTKPESASYFKKILG